MSNEPRLYDEAKVMVNPARKFVVTESYEDFDIFDDGKTEKERK